MTVDRALNGLQTVVSYGKNDSGGIPPLYIAATTIISVFAIKILTNEFNNPFQMRFRETWRDRLGRLALYLPPVKRVYDQQVEKSLESFKESVREKWRPFEPLETSLPDKGWSNQQLWDWLMKIHKITLEKIEHENISGAIYGPTSKPSEKVLEAKKSELDSIEENSESDQDYFSNLSKKLSLWVTAGSSLSSSWNLMHLKEFPIGSCLNYQVVHMVGKMFGAKQEEIMGAVTSGGTESLMLAIRAYRNWGMETKGHQPGQSVIIACRSVHAAVIKAEMAYSVKIVWIKDDEEGRMDLDKLRRALWDHGDNVVAIVASAPSYSLGVIDPIVNIAKLAEFHQCGLHVDSCLGAFVINHYSCLKTDYLALSGVTSLSADTHKNGLAPKGSSVIVTKPLFGQNLLYWSFYSIPDWEGGLYGSHKDAGSESCTPVLNTYLTLCAVGKEGYQRSARLIHKTTQDLECVIQNTFVDKLSLAAKPELNVIAIQLNPEWGIMRGGIYVFSEEMANNRFTLNNIKGDRIHICVTLRLACTPNIIEIFKEAVNKSLEHLELTNKELHSQGGRFSGNAGVYCSLAEAAHPKMADMSFLRFLQNLILGKKATETIVKAYLLALQNPY